MRHSGSLGTSPTSQSGSTPSSRVSPACVKRPLATALATARLRYAWSMMQKTALGAVGEAMVVTPHHHGRTALPTDVRPVRRRIARESLTSRPGQACAPGRDTYAGDAEPRPPLLVRQPPPTTR